MSTPARSTVQEIVGSLVGRLKYPWVFALLVVLFVADLLIPDPIPFVDEIVALTFEAVSSLDSTQKSDDILFYLGRLLVPAGGRRLAVLGREAPDRPFSAWPSLAGARDAGPQRRHPRR